MSSIRLHDRLGVNPRLTEVCCPYCAKKHTGQDLLLLGSSNRVYTCRNCGQQHVGLPRHRKCQNADCRSVGNFDTRELTDQEKIPAGFEVCSECREYMEIGILFICVLDDDEGKENPRRTGVQCVLTEEAVRERLPIQPDELKEQIIQKRMCFVPDAAWDMLGFPRENIDNRGKDSDDQS